MKPREILAKFIAEKVYNIQMAGFSYEEYKKTAKTSSDIRSGHFKKKLRHFRFLAEELLAVEMGNGKTLGGLLKVRSKL